MKDKFLAKYYCMFIVMNEYIGCWHSAKAKCKVRVDSSFRELVCSQSKILSSGVVFRFSCMFNISEVCVDQLHAA